MAKSIPYHTRCAVFDERRFILLRTSLKNVMASVNDRNTLEMSVLSAATEFDYLRFSVSDIHGISRGKSVPKRNLQNILQDGGLGIFCGK